MLKTKLLTRFANVLNEEQLMQMDSDDLAGVLNLYNLLRATTKSGRADRIRQLKTEGYVVLWGEQR